MQGGSLITLKGSYFGSTYSRCFESDVYDGISVLIGGRECSNVRYVSDSEIQCLTPSGTGSPDIVVSIEQGPLSRSGMMSEGFSFVLIYYAGFQGGLGGGYLGFGPSEDDPGNFTNPGSSFQLAETLFSKSVDTIAAQGERIFVGGSFAGFGESDVNFVVSWDGVRTEPLAEGLDGAVKTLTLYGDMLVVGGSFQKAFQGRGSVVRSPGLVGWNGTHWSTVGQSVWDGSVYSSIATGSKLYIGGQFRMARSSDYGGLAMFDGVQWHSLQGGVGNGRVNAIATALEDVYVGGSFVRAGGVAVQNIAQWDGRQWHAMGDVNGDVYAIAVLGEFVFVGGDFSAAGEQEVNHVAYYQQGRWYPLRSGLDGPVYSLVSVGSCLYLGGSFLAAVGEGSAAGINYGARWCVDLAGGEEPQFEPVSGLTSVGPVRTMASAVGQSVTGFDEEVCPSDQAAIHCEPTPLMML